MENSYKNLAELYDRVCEKYKGEFLIDLQKEVSYTYEDVKNYAYRLAKYLQDQGIKKGDKVALFMDNSPFWLISDYALHLLGAVNVARTSQDKSELEFILKHSDSKVLIYDEKYDLNSNVLKIPSKKLEEIVKDYERLEHKAEVNPDDIATIVYTSGTTSNPKGVLLTHKNIIFDALSFIDEVKKRYDLNEHDAIISILPEWHMYERSVEYGVMHLGVKIYYDSLYNFKKHSLFSEKINVIPGVPALWINVKKQIEKKIHENKFLGKLYDFLYDNAKNYYVAKALNRNFNPIDKLYAKIFDALFAKSIRKKLGNKKLIASGGSYLPADVEDFFLTIRIPLLNGYGLTEASPIVSARFDESELYSLGKPPKGIEVKLNENGVLMVKGDNVMKGYYKNPEATEEVLKDGWLITGDKFEIIDGKLYFHDRRKDLIVLPNGENVEPQKLETILEQHDKVKFAFVFNGNDVGLKSNIAALVLIDDFVKDLKSFESELKQYLKSKKLNNYEIINQFLFSNDDFTVGNELTSTFKKKRENILQKLKHLVNQKVNNLSDYFNLLREVKQRSF